MHALTCYKAEIGDIVYAMIPTYYKPNQFISCRLQIDWIYNSEMSIFYHCSIVELLGSISDNIKILSTGKVRCIHRQTGKLSLQFIPIQPGLSIQSLTQQVQVWQSNFILDVPAPYVVKDFLAYNALRNDIITYFKNLANAI